MKLKTYAEYKIRGAILDSLRGSGLGSAAAAQAFEADRGGDGFRAEHRLHRSPTEEEIAQELGLQESRNITSGWWKSAG